MKKVRGIVSMGFVGVVTTIGLAVLTYVLSQIDVAQQTANTAAVDISGIDAKITDVQQSQTRIEDRLDRIFPTN